MVSGYPIEFNSGVHNDTRFEPVFHVEPPTGFNLVEDDGGFAVFTVNDISLMNVGFGCHADSAVDANYSPFTGFITAIDVDNKKITTTIAFLGTSSGSFQELLNIKYPDTPKTILREVVFQLQNEIALEWEITLDGVNWMSINNGESLIGLSTFTIFVTKDEQLNIRYSTITGMQVAVICIVASAE